VNVSRRHPLPDGDITWEPSERWVRGRVGDETVVDSHRPILVWRPGHAVPLYAFPDEDVRVDLLREGAASFDLVLGSDVREAVAWRFEAPELAGYLAFDWFGRTSPGLDHWYEEEEEIFVHPRDPYKRIDAIPSSRHVTVEIDGIVVADSHRPTLLFETRLPTRYYLPREDVRLDLFDPTDLRTGCPYKGTAEYWSLRNAGQAPPNIAWSYPDPIPAAGPIAGQIAFYNEAVDITLDGRRLERPETPFTKRLS
jgi:uncharacterized protein (DUF427 family)